MLPVMVCCSSRTPKKNIDEVNQRCLECDTASNQRNAVMEPNKDQGPAQAGRGAYEDATDKARGHR